MLMFVMAAALLVTGGVLGAPWLSTIFAGPSLAAAAQEAGVVCPPSLVGLALTNESEGIFRDGDLISLECRYALQPTDPVAVTVKVKWTESSQESSLLRTCGLPPSINHNVFIAEGTYYGAEGQSRADYSGQRRYLNAMETLAANLARRAASIAAPCPGVTPLPTITPVNTTGGEGGGNNTPVVGAPSGSPAEQATATAIAIQTANPGGSGTPPAGASGTPGAGAPTPEPGSCLVVGRVTDSDGIAVRNALVTLRDSRGAALDQSATNNSGIYEFARRMSGAGAVVFEPTDFGRNGGTFRIFSQQSAVKLERQVDSRLSPGGECRADFDLWDPDKRFTAVDSNLARWPSIMRLYQNFNNAATLADMTGAPLDYGLPVPVYAWCDSADLFCDPTGAAEFAFYAGSTPGRIVDEPYIALGFPTSEAGYRGVPDNREYHEYGHAFMADVLGDRVPVQAGNINHGGYYRNASTTDSWVEGFAEFYSMMVSKHVAGEANPERYKIGAEYDLEEDRLPWEAVGWWEEFTIAGLLLDFEDGDSDYAQPLAELDIESVAAVSVTTGKFAIGRVRNSAGRVTHSPEITVELVDRSGNTVFTQVTTVKPQVLGPGQTGVFYVAAPDGVEFENVNAAPGRPRGVDDDPVDVELDELMRVLTSDWGRGDRVIETVTDLYEALSDAFAGRDGITQADIDTIFLRHGFFDDLNGSKSYEPAIDGAVGGSAHPSAIVSRTTFPERMPRYSADPFTGSFVTIDTAGRGADLLVQVEMAGDGGSRSYAYWTAGGSSEAAELAVPSSGSEGAVTVIAVADGYDPVVAFRTTAALFHSALEAGEITPAGQRSSVAFEPGNPLALIGVEGSGPGGSGGSSNPPWVMVAPVVLAGFMLAGGAYMMRRNSRLIPKAVEEEPETGTRPENGPAEDGESK